MNEASNSFFSNLQIEAVQNLFFKKAVGSKVYVDLKHHILKTTGWIFKIWEASESLFYKGL